MELIRANNSEANQIRELQLANLRDKPGESDDGFVEMALTEEQLLLMIESGSVIVARQLNEVVGYLIVPTFSVAREIAVIGHFIDQVLAKGLATDDMRIFSICVKRGHRGEGIASRLYDFYRSNFGENAISEVLEANRPSWHLHIEKEAMKIVGEYQNEANERAALILLEAN